MRTDLRWFTQDFVFYIRYAHFLSCLDILIGNNPDDISDREPGDIRLTIMIEEGWQIVERSRERFLDKTRIQVFYVR